MNSFNILFNSGFLQFIKSPHILEYLDDLMVIESTFYLIVKKLTYEFIPFVFVEKDNELIITPFVSAVNGYCSKESYEFTYDLACLTTSMSYEKLDDFLKLPRSVLFNEYLYVLFFIKGNNINLHHLEVITSNINIIFQDILANACKYDQYEIIQHILLSPKITMILPWLFYQRILCPFHLFPFLEISGLNSSDDVFNWIYQTLINNIADRKIILPVLYSISRKLLDGDRRKLVRQYIVDIDK